jgi:hypothetical protein
MTPLQLFRETTTRSRSWPAYAWAIVAGAAFATLIAVVLLAWQASRMMHARHRGPHPAQTTYTNALPQWTGCRPVQR